MRLIKLVFMSNAGPTKGIVPDKWCVEFCPLWQASEKEMAEARKIQADIDGIYLDKQVLSPEDVAKSRFGADGYSFDTKVNLKALMQLQLAMVQQAAVPPQLPPGAKPPAGKASPAEPDDKQPQARAGAKPDPEKAAP